MHLCQGTIVINMSLEPLSPEFTTPSSPASLYNDIATSLILQPVATSVEEKLAQTLAAMERMEKLMEVLNRDFEGVKEENWYLKAVADMNNDPTNPDHPLYQEPVEKTNPPPVHIPQSPPRRSVFSPPADYPPLPPPIHNLPSSSEKPEMKYKEPKIATPLPFDGKRENTESFLNSCSLYISARPSEFQSEDAKMHWIMLYMQSGSARLWRDYIMAQVRSGVKQFSSAHDLMNEIESKFGEEDKQTTMSLKLNDDARREARG